MPTALAVSPALVIAPEIPAVTVASASAY